MTNFPLPPTGMLSEQVDLPDHNLSLGLLHVDGAGIRVCAWDGERLRHMAPAAARRWAADLDTGAYAAAFAPVVDALTSFCERVEEIEAMMLQARSEYRGATDIKHMLAEGHA